MIAASHQQQFKLYRLEYALAGAVFRTPNALEFLSLGHAVPSCPVVDNQSTTGAMACGATKIAFSSNPRDV